MAGAGKKKAATDFTTKAAINRTISGNKIGMISFLLQ